ncbi:MAG: hypothetical protein AAFN41_05535 [Planctomycetota bacterium]
MSTDSTSPSCGTDCCPAPAATATTTNASTVDLRDKVREGYSEIAKSGQWSGVRPASARVADAADSDACCGGGGCCGPTTLTPEQVALAVGYAGEDLTVLPEGSNMGFWERNEPHRAATSSLRP